MTVSDSFGGIFERFFFFEVSGPKVAKPLTVENMVFSYTWHNSYEATKTNVQTEIFFSSSGLSSGDTGVCKVEHSNFVDATYLRFITVPTTVIQREI